MAHSTYLILEVVIKLGKAYYWTVSLLSGNITDPSWSRPDPSPHLKCRHRGVVGSSRRSMQLYGSVDPHFPYQPCRAGRNQQRNYPMEPNSRAQWLS